MAMLGSCRATHGWKKLLETIVLAMLHDVLIGAKRTYIWSTKWATTSTIQRLGGGPGYTIYMHKPYIQHPPQSKRRRRRKDWT